jgi:hypothetical protein
MSYVPDYKHRAHDDVRHDDASKGEARGNPKIIVSHPRLTLTLAILGRSWAQLIIATLLFVYISYNNYSVIVYGSKNDNVFEKNDEKNKIMANKLLFNIFLEALISTVLVNRGLRDYIFSETINIYRPDPNNRALSSRNLIYLILGGLIMIVCLYNAYTLEGILPWKHLMTFAIVQGSCVLYLSSTLCDQSNAMELQNLNIIDETKYKIGISILSRTNLQIILSGLLCLWISYLNYSLFSQFTYQDRSTSVLVNAVLIMLFLFVSLGSVIIMSSALRDYIYAQAVEQSFPGSPYANGHFNLRYFFIGFSMLITGLCIYYAVEELLPYKNVLIYLSVQALVVLNFMSIIGDRIHSERIKNEGNLRSQ